MTTNGCGDYHRVWCAAFFSKPSFLALTFGPHQWIQHGRPHFQVHWPAFVLRWLSRRATATLLVNIFTLITIASVVSIGAEEPSSVHAKVGLHTSSTLVWLRPVRACLSHSACLCLNIPLASNLSRMSCLDPVAISILKNWNFLGFHFFPLGHGRIYSKDSKAMALNGTDKGDPLSVRTWYCGSALSWPAVGSAPKLTFAQIRDHPCLSPSAPTWWFLGTLAKKLSERTKSEIEKTPVVI